MLLVTEQLKSAQKDALSFEKDAYYNNKVCLKSISSDGLRHKTFQDSINSLVKHLNMGDDEVQYFEDLFEQNQKPLCCLPKGHEGKCEFKYDSKFPEEFGNKLKDVWDGPGNDYVVFKNRTNRAFPIQTTREQERNVKIMFKLKEQDVKLKAAIPVEFACTRFMQATAYFDFAALLTKQDGLSKPSKIAEYVWDELKKHADYLVKHHHNNGVYVLDDEGFLCCPVRGVRLKREWWVKDEDIESNNEIQFGHVIPVCSDKYMTRGGNVVPITRLGNLIQTDNPLMGIHKYLENCYNHTKPRNKENK